MNWLKLIFLTNMLKVYKDQCKNCLLSKDRIVSPERVKDIIDSCVTNQSFFICHKSSMKKESVMCKKFYDSFGDQSQLVRIAERLGVIEFVEQEDSEKFPTYLEMNEGKV